MHKVLEQNGKTEILSLYSVILMFQPHFPAFPFCFTILWSLYLACKPSRHLSPGKKQ